jgi:ABC-type branched-subunit amino acid transport system ATPase component
MTAVLLSAKNLSVRFGGVLAVNNVSFDVKQGEVFTLIGPNGAGKTTVFNLISRIYTPTTGEIEYRGEKLTHQPPHKIASLGIARTFQNIELFEHATVLHNLLIGRHTHRQTGLLHDLFFTAKAREAELLAREKAEQVIDFLDLQHHRDSMVAGLPYGVRKVVELARALCTEPQLLLLDEPSSGLNVEETGDMAFWIQDIQHELGITVLMVEHDMSLVSRVSDRVLAMNQGEVLAVGTPREVQNDPGVIEAYLGSVDEVTSLKENGMSSAPPPVSDQPVLKLLNVESSYGPIKAIRGVSLQVRRSEIATVLGSNGAGKSTILKTISGILDPRKGSIEFKGQDITAQDPALIVQQGLSHVPEGREVFPLLSVRDNLLMGAYTRKDRDGVALDMEAVYGYFPILRERALQDAGLLSGGQQQMLAISRALMASPDLILLDEPSLGLSPKLTKEIFEIVVRINRERGTTILLVEQNANMALNASDYGYVLENGRIVMEDTCARLREKEDIKEFYLGMKEDGVRGERRWKKKKTWR